MVSGGLLLQEKYKFSFFSTEPGSLLHHTSDIWYKRIVSKRGLLFGWFWIGKTEVHTEAVLPVLGSMHDVPQWYISGEEGDKWPQRQGNKSHSAALQSRNSHLRRVKAQMYTAWRGTGWLLSSSSYQGAAPTFIAEEEPPSKGRSVVTLRRSCWFLCHTQGLQAAACPATGQGRHTEPHPVHWRALLV